MASGSQAASGSWADLPMAANRKQKPMAAASPGDRVAARARQVGQRGLAGLVHEQGQGGHETEIAHPGHEKGLAPGIHVDELVVPEADQGKRAKPHPFPAQKQEDQIVGQGDDQHEEHEQVEIAEVAGKVRVVAQVGGGIAVDAQGHEGDGCGHEPGDTVAKQRETHRQAVENQPVAQVDGLRRHGQVPGDPPGPRPGRRPWPPRRGVPLARRESRRHSAAWISAPARGQASRITSSARMVTPPAGRSRRPGCCRRRAGRARAGPGPGRPRPRPARAR